MKFFRLIILASILFMTLFASPRIHAQELQRVTGDACAGEASRSSICTTGNRDPLTGENGIILRVTAIVSYIIGFVSVLMIVIAGLKFVTSSGNPEGVASARNTILYAAIGLAIAASSQLIVRFVINLL